MFDMDKIGKKISEARKKQNMTQMELADRLNISFQAVSNWERGISMPDISKLSELSEILQITIDELIGKESPLMENIIKEKTEDYLEEHSVTTEELIDIAPILKPSQLDDVVSNTVFEDFSGMDEIAPFLSTEVIDRLAVKMSESGSFSQLGDIAPFISKPVLNEIAKKIGSTDKYIDELLPFLDKETTDSMAVEIYDSKGINSLDDFFPFISKEKIGEIAGIEFIKNGLRFFDCIAPFMNKSQLNGFAKEAIEKHGIKAISPIAPFLDRTLLNEYIKEKYL